MKRLLIVALMVFALVAPAFAEQVMSFKAESVSILKTKAGEEYVRIITGEAKESNGIKYTKTSTVLAFRDMVAAAKQIKAGDTFTAVVDSREYQGRTSYSIIGLKSAVAAKK